MKYIIDDIILILVQDENSLTKTYKNLENRIEHETIDKRKNKL